jgi:hypothetical protein
MLALSLSLSPRSDCVHTEESRDVLVFYGVDGQEWI